MNNLLTPRNIKNKSNQDIFYKTNKIKPHQGKLSFGESHSEMSTAELEVRPDSLDNLLLYGYNLGQNKWKIWTTPPSNFNDAKMGRFPSFAPSSLPFLGERGWLFLCILSKTAISDKINGTFRAPLTQNFIWSQNNAFLLLRYHSFIIALEGRGLIVPFYSVQDCSFLRGQNEPILCFDWLPKRPRWR